MIWLEGSGSDCSMGVSSSKNSFNSAYTLASLPVTSRMVSATVLSALSLCPPPGGFVVSQSSVNGGLTTTRAAWLHGFAATCFRRNRWFLLMRG